MPLLTTLTTTTLTLSLLLCLNLYFTTTLFFFLFFHTSLSRSLLFNSLLLLLTPPSSSSSSLLLLFFLFLSCPPPLLSSSSALVSPHSSSSASPLFPSPVDRLSCRPDIYVPSLLSIILDSLLSSCPTFPSRHLISPQHHSFSPHRTKLTPIAAQTRSSALLLLVSLLPSIISALFRSQQIGTDPPLLLACWQPLLLLLLPLSSHTPQAWAATSLHKGASAGSQR